MKKVLVCYHPIEVGVDPTDLVIAKVLMTDEEVSYYSKVHNYYVNELEIEDSRGILLIKEKKVISDKICSALLDYESEDLYPEFNGVYHSRWSGSILDKSVVLDISDAEIVIITGHIY